MQCIIQAGRVVLTFPETANLSKWPLVTDGPQESIVSNVNDYTVVSADIPDGTSVQELALVNGAVVRVPPVVDYAAIRARKLVQIGAQCEARIEAIVTTYPVNERLTFAKQQTECDAWVADHAAATPLIDAIIAQNGLTKADAIANIQAKSVEFSTYCGTMVGYKQKLMALLETTADADLDLFDPLAGWP